MSQEDIYRVTPEDKLLIEKLSGKTKEEITDLLEELKQWLLEQPHLPQNIDTPFLGRILQLNKYDMKKAKRKLDLFFAIRHKVPEFHNDRSPRAEHMKNILNHVWIVPLPKLFSEDVARIYAFRFDDKDSSKFDIGSFTKFVFSVFDLRIHNDEAQGEIFVCDFQNVSIGHIIKLNLYIVGKMYTVLARAYSDRIKAIHFINMPTYGYMLISIVKYVLSWKLGNRVFVHKDEQALQEAIPKEYLPEEYGGTLGTLKEYQAKWLKFVDEKNDWLIDEAQKRTNEKFRPVQEDSASMRNMYGLIK